MGYTHYWTQPKDYSKKEWTTICEDVGAILKDVQHVQSIPLAWEYDAPGKEVEISDKSIRFNGLGDDGHETFYIERKRTLEEWQTKDRLGSAFCKTARKPYDIAVVAVLAYLGSLEKKPWSVSSDGHGTEWLEGVTLARRCVPRLANQIDIPLDIRKSDRWDYASRYDLGLCHNVSDKYAIGLCLDGKVYVYDYKTETQCYCFPTAAEAKAYFAPFKEKPIKVSSRWAPGGWSKEGGQALFATSGSYDEKRRTSLRRAQDKILKALIDVAERDGRNQRPPAFARPNEMAATPQDGSASLEDLYQLCEAA